MARCLNMSSTDYLLESRRARLASSIGRSFLTSRYPSKVGLPLDKSLPSLERVIRVPVNYD